MNRLDEEIWSIQNTAPYCNELLEAFKVLDENYDEEEYLNGLLDSIRISVKESRKVLSQYDLEEEHIK